MSGRVAIIVPLAPRPYLLDDEEVSMRHLCHYLGRYDKYAIAPKGLHLERDGFHTLNFSRRFFGSCVGHHQLMSWRRFYERFEAYEYILIYHLDSLVFADRLIEWCDRGFDYIGAPWLPCSDTPWVKTAAVGNGGFGLMKVASVLDVLRARHRVEPLRRWSDLAMRHRNRVQPLATALTALQRVRPRSRVLNRIVHHWNVSNDPLGYGNGNDLFWSFQASRYRPSFRVAGVEDGLQFAFEAAPRRCFELNGGRLPFGCHAWPRYDREFWQPHLLPAHASTPTTISTPGW
jgi:hypothetical protein